MTLVEIVRPSSPRATSSTTSRWSRGSASAGRVGDNAGFIANALLFGYLNHAAAMFETKYASREDIDAAMSSAAACRWDRWPCST